MKRLTIPLARIIVDPEQDTNLSSVPEAEIQQVIRDCYSFLPKQTEPFVENDAVVIVLQEGETLSTPAKKQYDRAVTAAEQGRYQKAIEQFEKVVEAAPGHTEARRNLAMAYLEAGQVEQAKRLLVETLRLDPNDTWAYVLLGNLYAKNEDNFERARHYYDKAYELNPKDVYLITAYGALLANQEEYAEARSLFEKAIAINPSYPNSYGGLALAYLRGDDPASALTALDDLFDRSSSNDIRSAPLYEEARQLYLEANKRISEASFDDLIQFVEDRRTALERRIGVSVKIEEDNTLDYVTG